MSRATLLLVFVVVVTGCTTRRAAREAPPEQPGAVLELALDVPLPDGTRASVPAELHLPPGDDAVPFVLVVPGGGNVSRRGTRTSDGEVEYPGPVHVTHELARALGARGMAALAWDKRTCGPRDDAACGRSPTADLDVQGPRAMAADVDAACALARAHPRARGLVLWAHGQAAQVALASSCAATADAIVLVAPPPRRIDRVLVAALEHRSSVLERQAKRAKGDAAEVLAKRGHELKERAAGMKETFKAIEGGKFPAEARLLGFPIAYWKGWMALTDEIPGANPAPPPVPWIVVTGEHDVQFAPADQKRIAGLGALPGAQALVISGADHHLLVDGALDEARLLPIFEALDAVLGGPGEV